MHYLTNTINSQQMHNNISMGFRVRVRTSINGKHPKNTQKNTSNTHARALCSTHQNGQNVTCNAGEGQGCPYMPMVGMHGCEWAANGCGGT